MICRHCGASLPPIAMFCGECGRSVAARTPVVPPVVLSAAAPPFSPGEVLSITPATPPEAPDRDASVEPRPPHTPPGSASESDRRSMSESDTGIHSDRVPAEVLHPREVARASIACAACGADGEHDDLFCGECGVALTPDTRVIERLPASASAAAPPSPSAPAAPPPSAPPRDGDAPVEAGGPARPDVADVRSGSGLPSWASLLTGTPVPAAGGPTAKIFSASAVPVPAEAAPAAPIEHPVSPVDPSPPSHESAATALPLAPPLAPPPRLEPDVEGTRLVPRSLAGARFVLQFSTGESYTVIGSGLIGRNPRAEPGEVVDHLVTIVDRGRSVSKTHLEFGQDSGVFHVSDRHSGNGTILREPGSEPRYAQPGRRYRVVRGTRVDLGEQFVVIS